MIEETIKKIEKEFGNSFVLPKKRRTHNINSEEEELLTEFLREELREREFYKDFAKTPLLFEYRSVILNEKSYFKVERKVLESRLNETRKKLNTKEARFISSKNRTLAENVFLNEINIFIRNKYFCFALLEEVQDIEKRFYYGRFLTIEEKFKLLSDKKNRNEMLKQIYGSRQRFENYHKQMMRLKANMIANIKAYQENFNDVLADEDLPVKLRGTLKNKLTISFPLMKHFDKLFNEFSKKETEFLEYKANCIWS